MSYIGKEPQFTQYPSKFFNGDGTAMTVTLDYSPPNAAALLVFIDGVRQDTSAYTLSGTSLTFTGTVPSGTNNVQVVHLGLTQDVGVPSDDTISTAKIQDDAVTTAKIADDQVTSAKLANSLNITSGNSLTIDSGATITNNGTASGFGLFTSYAIILDSKTPGTQGGTFTSGAWRTRDLNTIHADPDSIVTLSANQFTLPAGTYWIEGYAQAGYVQQHQLAIYDVTGNTRYGGVQNFSQTTGDMWTTTMVSIRHTAVSSNTYELQHRCRNTSSTTGFGISHGNYWTDVNDIYAVVKIFKEA